MAKKKRTGLDALQEYEAGSGYAASSATSYGQTQTQGKTTTFKRSGLDALREYEQYKNPGAVQDTAFDPNYRSRNYQTPGQNAAFEAYKNAVNATQKTRNGVAVSGKVSEQEYSRSSGMQKQYGTYQNYLRGVEAAQGLKLGTLALQGQSALLAGRFAPATQQARGDVDAQNRRAKAAQTAQRDQVRGMRRTSQELDKQIEALEIEQADTHFSGTGLSENGKSVTQLQNEIDALKERKAQVDSQSVLARAQEAIGNLSEEDQNLLRQYRGKELNGYQVRAYAKYDAKTALNEKGYDDEKLKQLAEWQKVLDDYDNAQKLDQAAQEMGSGSFAGKAAATLFSAALAPGKALGNLESLRGVLPKWAGGYRNEDMPTNIYSPAYNASRLSYGIRQSVMQNMNPTGQFLYQAGTSALDSAVNMAVSTGLVGTVGGAAGAGAKDAIAETMNWVMGSQVAADSVYEGIQNGKSNADALVDGIVEGAIEGFTEKYSVGDIIENMLSGKAVWRKALRSFASEGAEEIASNWLNRAYDVVAKHDRGEVMTAYANYIAEGRTPAQALAAMVGDFAKEDSLSFLAGGLSGLAMSGTYAGVNRVILEANVTQTARAVIEAGEVQDVIDYGMAQEEGTKAHQLAEELQQTVDDGGEVTQKAVENTLREVAKEQQAAVDEGQEPRVPETLTRLEQLQEQARQEQAQTEADEKTFQIYKSAAETAQENQRLAQQYQQEQEQSRAQQSVQAVQQAQQAAQQQYNQDSLFAPIPGTESMGELDPVQYARQQTAGAEQALDEAALQQEEQYLQTQAQRAGYDEQTAAYFLNGNTTGMPAEQYAQSFGQVYEQGRLGASEKRAMRYAEGMNQDVAAAAYRAGLAAGQKGVNNGSIEVTDEGQVGQAGQRAEGQAGGVRQSTAQQQRADAGRKRAQGARDLAKAWDEVELSTLGFGKDNTQKVRVMPKGQEARSEDIQAAEKFFRSMGVQNARFFTGQLTQEIDGQTFYADAAVTEDGSVLIRADSEEYSAFELAKHEGYHLLVKRWPEMAAKIQKRLLGEGKITKEMIESYVDAYAGIYGDDTDAYVEEIVADTYAGMNRTDYGTNKLRADVRMEVGQWQKKSGSARAPPAKMSASKAEKYDFTKPFAEQVDDWKAGKIEKNDTLVVGSTPEVFQKVGFNALPVTINQTHVDYAINGTKDEEHHIGEPMLKQLPRAMKSPVAIIASESQRGTSVVALLPFIKDAKSVIIPVYIDGLGRQNSIVIDSNAVTSIYEKKNAVTGLLTNAIEKSNNGETTLFYVDKVKAAALYQVARVPMPKMPDTDNGFVASIRDEGSAVKPKLKNVTQSQQFKRWFGDWKNHPESASKVVNADGTPKVVYHGTNAEFNTFQQENGAYFFSESRDYAESMADERRGNRIIEAYLKMKNPYTVKLPPEQFTDNIAEAPFIRYAKEHGHDGVIFEYDGSKEDLAYDKFYVVFDSAQIKSATDNIGTFDKTNPDIRYSSASVRQASERDKQNLETVSAMLDDGSGRGVFKDAVFLRNPRLMQKLIDEREKTKTAAFRDWFADSKATNTTGEPLLVFHGAGAKFTKFDVGGKPIWLTANIKYAEEYSTATRSVERVLPEASIYAGNVDRIIPAYIRVENPADVGNTDGGYSGNYVDLAKRLQIRPSELQAVWEQAGKPELMWQVINTPGMVEMLKRHGYDGVQAVENGVKAWAVFDSAQVKSAVANNGSFSLTNPDIRYSSQDGRYRDLMGEKAAQYVRRLESGLVNELAENLSVPGQAKREVLRPMAEEALRTFFTDGQLDRAKLNDLFETAYQAGIEEDTQYIEQYGDLKKFIQDQKISISETDRQDIADYNLFRKAAMGTLTISKDGLPVDVAYQQLQEMAPELFPADITAPSDQLMQIYDVARGIQKVQKTLDEYYGPQAASFKKWQQANFTESIDRLTSGLRVAQRYLDAQNKAKEKLAIPQTAEETKQMWAQLKDARRVVEKAQSKTLLTEADQKIVNRLLRGETSPDYVAGLENGQQILKVYEAKADYDMLALKLKAWNAQRKQGLRDFAEQALTEAEAVKWADKNMGIRYQRETMERNIRDIARKGKVSDEKANAFINKYFWPVHENESKRKNYLVEQQDRIRELKLDRQVRKGNLVSESYAVQWLGEAEFNRDYLKQHPRVERRGGMTFDEWNAAIQEFEKQNPNLDLGKVRAAVKIFHEVYDKLFQDMNRVRIENGYEPVNYLQGYFPHFQENEEGGSILQKFARAAGIEGDVSPLPATINGLTANFKPGIRYMANIQNRLGYATAYDALQGFDRYIEVATDVIFHTADIQRLRALATQIRYRASDEGLKQRIDAIMMNPFLNPDEANEQVTNLTKEGRYGLSNFVDELDEYTNLLAGKKSRLDRSMEKLMGRRFYNVMKKFESRVGANMVAANVGSALTNFIPITQAWSQVSTADVLRGMWDTLKNYKTADGLDSASTFINNRSGYRRLAMSTMDKVSAGAGRLMESIDTFTTGSVVRARYYQNLRRGMSETSAMQEADQFASGVMADRSKGSTPTLYSARNPLVKLFTQFQLEVNNELSWIFKDMAQEERKKGVAALAKAMFKFLIGAWIYNEFYESIVGRRPALDPLDIINDTVGDFTGYQLPNTVQAAVSGKWDFTKEKPGTYQAIKNLEGNIISEFPGTQALTILGVDEALGLDIDSGRIAVASAIPNLGNIEKALLAKNEDMAPAKKAQTIGNELLKPGLYLATPFGGGQIRKAYQGATAAARGGSYTVDNEGRDILQYPVYNGNAADRAKSWAQALLFGKTATEEAQSWVESGFKSLSAKETAAYQGMTEGGEDQRETYAFIQAARKLEKNYDKMMLLKAYDISDEAKAEYYYQVLAGDAQKAEMEPKSTQERIDYMNEKIQDAQDAKQKQDLKDTVAAGTVTQEKAIQKILANDYAEDENKAYWLYKEWTGGKDYTKYGKILQTIEDGGDLKAAAKEYFDHGAEKGDIGSEITKAYKPQYIAASPEERKKLKEKLLAAYVALGFNRADKSKDIDKWLKDSK
nr:MAG TPA: PolyVal ADP-Ribosyltransferase [Caudoviricetes sp.]